MIDCHNWQQLQLVNDSGLLYSGFPLCYGGFALEIFPNSHALFDDIDVQVAPTPFEPAFEAKEYVNEEYGFSIKYPKWYVEEESTIPGCVFKATSSVRAPVPLPTVEVFIDDVDEDTTFAGLKREVKTELEVAGGKNIKFASEKETKLADSTTPAYELVLEWSVAGAPRLKTLILSVIKESKWFGIVLTDMADYWPDSEAELINVAYSLQFK